VLLVVVRTSQALLQKHSVSAASSSSCGVDRGGAESAQRQAERAHLAAFMSRRLVL
jgi:hypothetical protein